MSARKSNASRNHLQHALQRHAKLQKLSCRNAVQQQLVADAIVYSQFGLTSHLHLGLTRGSVRSLIFCIQLPRTEFSHQTSWQDLDVT